MIVRHLRDSIHLSKDVHTRVDIEKYLRFIKTPFESSKSCCEDISTNAHMNPHGYSLAERRQGAALKRNAY